MDIADMAREARDAALEARQVAAEARITAAEARNLAQSHINGCERAYAENERRLAEIRQKLDHQDENSAKYRGEASAALKEQDGKLAAIIEANTKRYYATVSGAGSLLIMLAWQVYVYLHPAPFPH